MNTEKTLEFNIIKQQLIGLSITENAKQRFEKLAPFTDRKKVLEELQDTTEAKNILNICGTPPLPAVGKLRDLLNIAQKGGMLRPEQLEFICRFLLSCKKLKQYFSKESIAGFALASYAMSLDLAESLYTQIDNAVQNDTVDSSASKGLKDIRHKKENIQTQIKIKLETMLKGKRNLFSDNFVSVRNGHFTLPVKKEYKNQVSGTIIDISSTGTTCFIEPTAVSKLCDTLSALEIEEERETEKILYSLTSFVDDYRTALSINAEIVEAWDYSFAKGKLSNEMNAVAPEINTERIIEFENGRHPLLNQSNCVPLDFKTGNGIRGVVITGPNTGGKTVALKTLGLFCLMAQSGLHIPCSRAKLCINSSVLCDIGDGQSITENLSTFSAHIKNILDILGKADDKSLVLLDELGSGTDPDEGMGIAIAVLEELKNRNCLFAVTTHYPDVKNYTEKTPSLVNARMTFDRDTMQPLYKLEIGVAGESCAFYIAKRLGFPAAMLKTAYNAAYNRTSGIAPNPLNDDFFDYETESEFRPDTNTVFAVKKSKKACGSRALRFQLGDSVIVYPQKAFGIVCKTADPKGNILVQIQGKKISVNHKRLQLKTPAKELYPENYDFSILFDSVETRKARHKMGKKHCADLEIILQEGFNHDKQ